MTPSEALPFHVPDISDAEIAAVTDVLTSRWLTTGSKVREFETAFADAVDAPIAVALNSCTAALHLSLEALGVGPGDLVFLPTYTFAATAEVVRYVGATPVLVDVDCDTYCLDVAALRARVIAALEAGEGRPAAVMPVHFAGAADRLHEIWDVAREFDLAVVEDAAHAFPSIFAGRSIGWMPDDVRGTTCFSFYATKTITTGEGGMVTCHDAELADRIRLMSLHGLSKQAWSRYAGAAGATTSWPPATSTTSPTSLRLLGLVQLDRSAAMTSRRTEIAARYDQAFHDLVGLITPRVGGPPTSAWHLYVLRVAPPWGELERDRLMELLKDRGVGTSMHFIPLHLHTYYRETYGFRQDQFPVAVDSFERSLSLPIYSVMGDSDIERVIDAVRLSVQELG